MDDKLTTGKAASLARLEGEKAFIVSSENREVFGSGGGFKPGSAAGRNEG